MIILGKTDLLLDQFADRLTGLEDTVSPKYALRLPSLFDMLPKANMHSLIGPLIRFFAHMILVLRNLGQPVPDLAANAILEAYLHVLELEGDDQLVAVYAACLHEGSGEESYARFLRSKSSDLSCFARSTLTAKPWTLLLQKRPDWERSTGRDSTTWTWRALRARRSASRSRRHSQ